MPLEGISDVPADALFEQVHVDKDRLASRVRQSLQTRPQISLVELVDRYPIEQGLAEIITYFSIAAEDHASIIDDRLHQTLNWVDDSGSSRQATLPMVIFCRPTTAATRTA